MLDLSCLLGNVPPRFQWQGGQTDVNTVFTIARGTQGGASPVAHEHGADRGCGEKGVSTYAGEMTKWFDTNYHYIVPEFRADTKFAFSGSKVFDEFAETKALGLNAKPVLIGPVTYLSLGKLQDSKNPDFDPFALFDNLLALLPAEHRHVVRL